jgi:single-stranded-DNA-specific exonuclease
MGRESLIRPLWKIINPDIPESVRDVIRILLQNRNIDPELIAGDLRDLESHLSMRGLHEGCRLMARHMRTGRKIVLVADYDCDGITSVAQMALFLMETGYKNFQVVIPLREEGYGIPERAVLENPDAALFVAMDCGTLDLKPIKMACSMGADCIVIDHHEVPDGEIAPASVLVNPKHPECCSSFKEFCASGLTLLFLAGLRRAIRDDFPVPALGGKYLALAAIGTVADMVPLVSANRILARSGLRNLNARSCPAVSELAEAAGLTGKPLTAGHIGFYIGPRINAAGRISDAKIAYDLLTSDRPGESAALARELNRLNATRQAQEETILHDIRCRIAGLPPATRTLVMGDPAWARGVVGIAASRVQQEIHYGPVVILSIDEKNGTARGSARSIPGFDIHAALTRCADTLLKWGGHKAAAGLTVGIERIGEFTDCFERVARRYPEEVFIPYGKVDMELPLEFVGMELLEALQQLEPHGMGNPSPTFAVRKAQFTVRKTFGKERNHLKLGFGNGIEGIFWRGAERLSSASPDETGRMDIVFQIDRDSFSGDPVLDIRDIGRLFQK